MYIPKYKRYPKTLIVLKEFGWQDSKQLLEFTSNLRETKFSNNGLFNKADFIDALVKGLDECEEYGHTLEELRKVFGFVMQEYYSTDYGHLMSCYKAERKKLRNLLDVLNVLSGRK